jgi:hypothetical protein
VTARSSALETISHLNDQIADVRAHLANVARRQPGCRALQANIYGVGPLTALRQLLEPLATQHRLAAALYVALVTDIAHTAQAAGLNHLDWPDLIDTWQLENLHHVDDALHTIHHTSADTLGL